MNDNFGARLGATLRETAPEQHPDLTLDDVRPAVRRIKRRRTTAALGGVAALTAVSALGAALVLPSLTASSPDGKSAGPAASTATPWTLPERVVLATDAPPVRRNQTEWFLGNAELSSLFPFAPGAQDAVARLGARWLLSVQDEADRKLYSIRLGNPAHGVFSASEAGPTTDVFEAIETADTFDLYDEVAISDGGDLAVFSTPEGVLTLIGPDGDTREIATLPVPGTPIDLIGGASCLTGTDCHVVVSYGNGAPPEVVSGDGTRTMIGDQAVGVSAANADLIALRTDGGVSVSCTTVIDRRSGSAQWESCENAVQGFSPDGRYVVVIDAYQSGNGPARAGIADAKTGEVLTWVMPGTDHGFIRDLQWVADGGLEVTSYAEGDQTWRLHHVSAFGATAQGSSMTGDPADPPHIAVTRP